MTDNPYSTPTTLNDLEQPVSEHVKIRRQYIKHEATVKSIGSLYILVSLFLMLSSWSIMMPAFRQGTSAMQMFLGSAIFGLAVFQLITGFAIRKLKYWSKAAIGVLSTIGLLGFPLGTIINGYILYLIFSSKGYMVYSREYQQVIEKTPEIKYQAAIVVWIFFVLLVVMIGVALIIPMYH